MILWNQGETPMLRNRVKRILNEGGVAIATYGGCFRGPEVVELIGHAGYDAVFIDMEHMAFDLRDIQMMVLAAERFDITPIVRTPGFDTACILRLLDMGVQAINVPNITNADTARAAVAAARYTPVGDRGLIGYSRSADYGKISLLEHTKESNREVMLNVMIEDAEAVEQIDAIAAIEGIDLIAPGPNDLAGSLGVPGQSDHPKLVSAMVRVAEAVRKSGARRLCLPLGHPVYPRTVAECKELGAGLLICGTAPEVRLRHSYSQEVAELRRLIGH
jgi:2-keto-3-deoxy-L-rhamnonate aldolase RhmA